MLAALEPILIASPIQRSGTTLIQRLLSSAMDTLIYGETCANDLNMLIGLYVQKSSMYGRNDGWRSDQMQQVLAGAVNDWIPDLMPDPVEYVARFEDQVAGFFHYFAEFARRHGREQWGAKLPGWNTFQLEQLLQIMPRSRVVYIVRDLEPCVRSAKQMELCRNLADVQQFSQFWLMNLQEARRRLRSDRVFWIDYKVLVAEPESVLSELEEFTGCQKIDRTVMDHRIGDYHQDTGPVPALSQEESVIIRNIQSQIKAGG